MRSVITGLTLAVLLAGPLSGSADAVPGYPPMRWEEASPANYTAGRAGSIRRIVVHATHGSYRGAISWFRSPGAKASAHYVIRAGDGEITQMVREADTAWHVRGANRDSIGIEHEYEPGRVGFTDAQYRSSAELVCAITRRYGLRADRTTVIGHVEVPGSDHTDPGPSWNWSYYMSLVARCSGASAAAAPWIITSAASRRGAVPPPGLGPGADGAAVRSLQDRLVALGFLRAADAATAPGFFGPFTQAAVLGFQRANGVPATGYYGSLSAAAMTRTAERAAAVPVEQLSLGARSEAVSTLQSLLRSLGHLDVVTGYFGPQTEAAVRRFQAANGVPATGVYGPLTRTALASRAR